MPARGVPCVRPSPGVLAPVAGELVAAPGVGRLGVLAALLLAVSAAADVPSTADAGLPDDAGGKLTRPLGESGLDAGVTLSFASAGPEALDAGVTSAVPPSPPVDEWKGLPNAFRVPGTDAWFHLGGFAHLDVIYDLNPIGARGTFAVGSIPFEAPPEETLYFQVNTSRLRFDVAHLTPLGRAQASLEFDFFTSSGAPRIRHAYAELGRVLAGQTWTTLTDSDCLPPTLDFEMPSSFIVRRQPQVRYTHPFGEDTKLSVAAEYPNFVLDPGAATQASGGFEVRAPDLILRLILDRGPVHLSLAGVGRYLRFRETSGALTEAPGVGGVLELRLRPHARLTLWGEAIGGQGIGGYRGVADLSVDRAGALTAVPILGGFVGATFNWLDNLRSTGTFSVGGAPFQAATSEEHGRAQLYASLNLQWFPVKRVMAGFEVLFGQHYGYLAGGAPTQAHAVRLQGAMRVMLP